MTTLQETIRERKMLVPGAYHRRRGSKSHKVTLPQDYLSPAQLRKKNGKVLIFKMKEPMTWQQFKAMPDDLARDYIDELSETFHVNYGALKMMFNVSPASMRSAFKTRGISFSPSHGTMSKQNSEAWEAFLSGSTTKPAEEDSIESVTVRPVDVTIPPDKPSMQMRSFSLNFDGPLDSKNLLQTLVFMIGEGTNCNIKIEVTK